MELLVSIIQIVEIKNSLHYDHREEALVPDGACVFGCIGHSNTVLDTRYWILVTRRSPLKGRNSDTI
jgi:hypothetical protein